MPRTKEQNEAMRQATNEKIMTAATMLFSRKGVAGTGVQEIADLAGISIGLLYKHYKTKDDVFKGLVLTAVDALKTVGDYFRGDPLEIMKWFTQDILNDIKTNEEFAHMMNVMTPASIADENFPCRDEVLEGHINFRNRLAALIERGQSQGVFKNGDPAAMALFYLTIVDGMSGMVIALKEQFVMPTPDMLTAHIIKEEFNNYG